MVESGQAGHAQAEDGSGTASLGQSLTGVHEDLHGCFVDARLTISRPHVEKEMIRQHQGLKPPKLGGGGCRVRPRKTLLC